LVKGLPCVKKMTVSSPGEDASSTWGRLHEACSRLVLLILIGHDELTGTFSYRYPEAESFGDFGNRYSPRFRFLCAFRSVRE
jgi:hypothetical protein